MSKRIVTEIGTDWHKIRNASETAGTNLDLIRTYGSRIHRTGDMYAVIIPNDTLFEGL